MANKKKMSWDKICHFKRTKFSWKTDVCKETRERKVDVRFMLDVRRNGKGARFVGTSERRYKLWGPGNDAGSGGVEILVEEDTSGNVSKIKEKATA